MEMEQELEWLEAQKIATSVDLLAAAKQQLQFLAAVDKNRYLYEGPALQRAIYRYNACWLPLLAKHSESQISEGPLVVPLDCEWVWHCHRLNPVRYKFDCEELYGRILDNSNVVSSVQGTFKKTTEEIWSTIYPEEPYDFDWTRALSEKISGLEKCTKYDLVSAVKRQSPFFYQVSRPYMNNDLFIEGAVARYKGFLHLIKRNKERSIKRFCVPTYDIDLIWHTHQLHPVSYCTDLNAILGKVLEHDDMDADRTKGKKLDVGFSGTTKQWEEMFGTRYWRAGAMYRGTAPSPLTITPYSSKIVCQKVVTSKVCQKMIQLPEVKVVEVLLEIVGVKNLPEGHKGSFAVAFSKTQPDVFFNAKRKLTIFSESGEKQVASFQCEPKGEMLFELISHSPYNLPISKAFKTMGTTTLSLQEFLAPVSKLSVEKWLELVPSSSIVNSKPICLRIAASFTVPTLAPYVLRMVCSRPFSKSSCFFPLPGRIQHGKSWTRVIDETDTEVISLQMRDSNKTKLRDNDVPRKQVIGISNSGETCTLAEFVGTGWSLIDSHWSLKLHNKSSKDDSLIELMGNRMLKFFPGRKLEYEPKHCEKQRIERDFMTAVEFSAEDPYGKAVALLDFKSGFVKIKEEWLVLPGITSAFIFSDILKKEGYGGFTVKGEKLEGVKVTEEENGFYAEGKQINQYTHVESGMESSTHAAKGTAVTAENAVVSAKGRSYGGSCGQGCDNGYENVVKSGGCGGCGGGCGGCGTGCGGGAGNMVKSGGCGGCGAGCGGGCGNMVKSGGCGGCGAGCGNMVKSGGCGGCGAGCGGGGCGNMVKSGGCGGCGGGGRGNKFAHEINAGKTPICMEEAVVA